MNGKASSRAVNAETSQLLMTLYESMLRIRIFEERVAELLEAGEIKTPTHLYTGQEAVAVGVSAVLRSEDLIWGNHRSHGHFLAKGGNMRALMAELYCKATGCSLGRGGSMHLFDRKAGILGTVPMVGATIPVAVGAALALAFERGNSVSVAYFGDGATEEGLFHESLNLASLLKLPVVFVCENNLYSSHLPLSARRSKSNLDAHAAPYGMHSQSVDGNDVVAVYQAAEAAVGRARRGEGPSLLEARTYRWRGHVGSNFDLDRGIRAQEELAWWMDRCPIKKLGEVLTEEGICGVDSLATLRFDIQVEVEDSVAFARESPLPNSEEVTDFVFAERR